MEQGPATFFGLNADCKAIIFDELVQEHSPIPGRAIVRPQPRVLVSLWNVCRHIRNQLRSELNRLLNRYLRVNTFLFNGLSDLDAVTNQALPRELAQIRSIRMEEYNMPISTTPHPSWQAEVAPLLRLPALTNLSLRPPLGPMDDLQYRRERDCMSMPESDIPRRYELHVR
jgi:hypothetical protein